MLKTLKLSEVAPVTVTVTFKPGEISPCQIFCFEKYLFLYLIFFKNLFLAGLVRLYGVLSQLFFVYIFFFFVLS